MGSSRYMNKYFSGNLSKWVRFLMGYLVAAVDAISLNIRLPIFWNVTRLSRVGLLIIPFIIYLLMVQNIYLFVIHKTVTDDADKDNWLLMFSSLLYLFSCAALLSIDFKENLYGFWLQGYRFQILQIIQYLYVFLNSLILLVMTLVLIKNRNYFCKWKSFGKKSVNLCFSVLFLCLCLLPLKSIVDINEFNEEFNLNIESRRIFQLTRYFIGDRIFEKTILSDDDWFVFTGEFSIPDYQNSKPFTDTQLEKIYSNLELLENYTNEKGMSLLIIVPPNKNTIYPEYVPGEIPVLGDTSRLDQVINYQAENGGVEILDFRALFKDAKQNQRIYYSTDTHWNNSGSFLAYQKIITELSKKYPELVPLDITEFEESDSNRLGDISEITGLELKEMRTYLTPRDELAACLQEEERGQYRIYTNTDNSMPELFVYHDSFGVYLKTYLPYNFSKSTFMHHLDGALSFSDIKEIDADIVIIEFTERFLSLFLTELPSLE